MESVVDAIVASIMANSGDEHGELVEFCQCGGDLRAVLDRPVAALEDHESVVHVVVPAVMSVVCMCEGLRTATVSR